MFKLYKVDRALAYLLAHNTENDNGWYITRSSDFRELKDGMLNTREGTRWSWETNREIGEITLIGETEDLDELVNLVKLNALIDGKELGDA